MTRFSLLIAVAAIVGIAGLQTSTPAHSCAASGPGLEGLQQNFEQVGGITSSSWSRDGTLDGDQSTPRFVTDGRIIIGSNAGAHTSENSVVSQRNADASRDQSILFNDSLTNPCPN